MPQSIFLQTQMTDPRCDQLDEYLCGWLSPDDAADFVAHLAVCPACREECGTQRTIDRLLAERAARVEQVPAVLTGRIERGRRAARRRRIGWAGALTAAAGIVLALGLWASSAMLSLRGTRQSPVQTPIASNDSPAQPAAAKPQAVAARVTLVDPSSAILVPIESHSPNVTIVCVYPTVKVAREDAKRPSR